MKLRTSAILSSVLGLVLVLCAGPLSAQPGDDDKTKADKDTIGDRFIVLGVSPQGDGAAMFRHYGPLVAWLNDNMDIKQRITLESTPTEALFRQRTQARMYDIIIAAPHLALEELDKESYNLIAMPDKTAQVRLVVHEQSSVKSPAELAGKVVAVASQTSLNTRAMVETLEQQGLSGGSQPVYMDLGSDQAALEALMKNEADAAIISGSSLGKARKDKTSVRAIGKGRELPGNAVMVAIDLPEAFQKRLKKLLLGMANKKEGKEALKALPFSAFKQARTSVYQPMRVYMIRDPEPEQP